MSKKLKYWKLALNKIHEEKRENGGVEMIF